MLVNIRVPVEPPPTHQAAVRIMRRANGQMFIGKPASSNASKWNKQFELLLKQWKPEQPMSGVLRMSVHFAYGLLKKHKRTYGGGIIIESKITRPDCDNLVKSVMDCLTRAGYILDDANVAHLSISKSYHYKGPFVDVIITEEKNNPFKDPENWIEGENEFDNPSTK